jgi:predicted lysophospholipase L1 biosynthesis ABC-type transport system permease subunit
VAALLKGGGLGVRFSAAGVGRDPDTEYEVVGIAKNQKYLSMREPFPPIVYLASSQNASPGLTRRYVVRSTLLPAQITAAFGAALRKVHPDIAVRFAPLERQVGEAMLQERLMARLSVLFGGVALALAVVGLYGVVAYGVSSRRGEIGIRLALGARRGRIVGLMLGEVGVALGAGLIAGVLTALAVARAVRTLLFGLSPHDPAVVALAVALLGATGFAAAAIPARRAAAIDPVETLRDEC